MTFLNRIFGKRPTSRDLIHVSSDVLSRLQCVRNSLSRLREFDINAAPISREHQSAWWETRSAIVDLTNAVEGLNRTVENLCSAYNEEIRKQMR
jgi:hypothetical protein